MGSVEIVRNLAIAILLFSGIMIGVGSIINDATDNYGGNFLSDSSNSIVNNLTGYHLDQSKGDLDSTTITVYEELYNNTNSVDDGQDAEGDLLKRAVSGQKEFFNIQGNFKGMITGISNVFGNVIPSWVFLIASTVVFIILLGATISFLRSGR